MVDNRHEKEALFCARHLSLMVNLLSEECLPKDRGGRVNRLLPPSSNRKRQLRSIKHPHDSLPIWGSPTVVGRLQQ